MNPGEIYTAPDGRKYRAEKEIDMCEGCAFIGMDECRVAPVCNDPAIIFKRIPNIPDITYSLIESLRTGRSWPGGVPDSNSFHMGARAMAQHLGYEVESTFSQKSQSGVDNCV